MSHEKEEDWSKNQPEPEVSPAYLMKLNSALLSNQQQRVDKAIPNSSMLQTQFDRLEPVERVEFIIKKFDVICNVCLNQPAMNEYHKWVHKVFPASIPIIDFMMNGGLEDVKHWAEGRLEK